MDYSLINQIDRYIKYCKTQKYLSPKTIDAYKTDLYQFATVIGSVNVEMVGKEEIEKYVSYIRLTYLPRTTKRKLASIKAFFNYMEYNYYIKSNPFKIIRIRIKEPVILPKTIPISDVKLLLQSIYHCMSTGSTLFQRQSAMCAAAVIELLFCTGIRVSELCSLRICDVNLTEGFILIHGKGSKERIVNISNTSVLTLLRDYSLLFSSNNPVTTPFFINPNQKPINDQAIRRIIKKYCDIAGINEHITPHMFRHTFASSLLDADVDIRYIQSMLGHSSIKTTEIYTHVSTYKTRVILENKHPRNQFNL